MTLFTASQPLPRFKWHDRRCILLSKRRGIFTLIWEKHFRTDRTFESFHKFRKCLSRRSRFHNEPNLSVEGMRGEPQASVCVGTLVCTGPP